MHLLGHGALSLHQVFHPEKSAAEQLTEIDATVAIIAGAQPDRRRAVASLKIPCFSEGFVGNFRPGFLFLG